jgi:epoxyqueuosine reductase QueG
MTQNELTTQAKNVALAHGADLIGVVKAADLLEHTESMYNILPDANSILVCVSRHSLAAISSGNNEVAQLDTIHTYDTCVTSAHKASRFLESKGFSSVAVPAFIPIDMQAPKYGMQGEICWRRAGVRAGLGSYGENGLLVTREFGSAIRISGLITSADLKADAPLNEDVCDHCMACVDICPAEALSGKGQINKKRCGDVIFKFGFRFFKNFIHDLIQKPPNETEKIIDGHGIIEMWQTFMTGNYYYCFRCQTQCPATKLPRQTQTIRGET